MAVLGTAGHVDHGKTTLVRALTGVDTDRLPEEKRRGITIELGFAPMTVVDPGGGERTVAIVDVPGHERFVGTMVSGAQGVDVALLVVAADAGVMPQTREHLVILEALGVESLIVALTRSDIVDPEMRALARLDVEEALAGTRWTKAPILEVSGKTGEGIDALKKVITDTTRAVDRGTRAQRPARLAIDRAFAPRGQGVVVTGTLVAGAISVGDELELLPRGLRLRVRGLHQHGNAVPRAHAGGRLAIALAGIELADLHRGEVLVVPGTMIAASAFDAVFTRPARPESAAGGGRRFGRRARVSIHAGTDEVPGRLVPLVPLAPAGALPGAEPKAESTTTIAVGERWLVRVVTRRPLAVAVGDRLVIRGDAPLASVGTTLGAAEVVRVAPGRVSGTRARYAEQLRALTAADEATRATFEIDHAGLSGLSREQLAPRLASRAIGKELARSLVRYEIRGGGTVRFIGDAARAKASSTLRAALARFHQEHPDDEGAPLATIVSTVPQNAAPGLAEWALEKAIEAKEIVRHGEKGEKLRLASFKPRARVDDPAALEIERRIVEGGLAPPTLPEIGQALGLETSRARALAQALSTAGKIVHVQGDLWFEKRALDALRGRLVAWLEEKNAITTGEFKDMVGASRKFVVPLAEWFDAQKVTLRVGDVRKLRK